MNTIQREAVGRFGGAADGLERSGRRLRARWWVVWVVAGGVAWLGVGCAKTRSISNAQAGAPGMQGGRMGVGSSADPGFEYRGELNEFDVLGVDRTRVATEEEIARALDEAKGVTLRPGSRLLVVQSGAVMPDGPMVTELERHFDVVPFSGVPPERRTATEPEPVEAFSLSRGLRLAAARAGAETIVCYWGTLESARRRMETKTVSWVPIAGWVIPDESQQMRIRLKMALVDVRTGSWRVVVPEPLTDKAWSTAFTRGSSDLRQVEELKGRAYVAGAARLVAEARGRVVGQGAGEGKAVEAGKEPH